MTEVTRCDKCKKIFEDNKVTSFRTSFRHSISMRFDLCNDCLKVLAQWLGVKKL